MKVNINDIEWQAFSEGDFSYFRKSLGSLAGGEMLGASIYKLLPGKKAFPFHCHFANEEAILILLGEGSVRLGVEMLSIKANDYIALPRGPAHSHQIINTSSDVLIYLCFSTMIEPEVMEYPDSKKIGFMVGSPPGGEKNSQSEKNFYLKTNTVSYYEDEK